jgi:hypothetical protein
VLNLYLWSITEGASDEQLAMIEAALEPPLDLKNEQGVPVVYGSDEEAWEQFASQL